MRWSEINEASEPELLRKKIVLNDGTPALLKVTQGSYGPKVAVWVGKQFAGSACFGSNDYMSGYEGTFSATDTGVNQEFRRKGINSAMYDAVEELGYKLIPEPRHHKRTADADAFWKSRKLKVPVRESADLEGNWKTFDQTPPGAKIVMYHATSTSAAEAIMANGFNASKKVWMDSRDGYIYLGLSPRSLAIYGVYASKHDDPPVVLVVEVSKGDVEPDDGGDWSSYLRNPNTKRDVVNQFGKEAIKTPTATVTLAEIGQAKAKVAAVTPIRILPFKF